MITLNLALQQGEIGNWDAAWEIAKEDEGLNSGVTREIWIKFALKAIDRRNTEKKANNRFFRV